MENKDKYFDDSYIPESPTNKKIIKPKIISKPKEETSLKCGFNVGFGK